MVHLRDDIWANNRGGELQIIAISVGESAATVQAWLDSNPMPFPVLVDQDYEVFSLFTNGGVPFNSVIDAEHQLRFRGTGFSASALQYWIDAIFEEAPADASSWSNIKALYQ